MAEIKYRLFEQMVKDFAETEEKPLLPFSMYLI